MKLQHLLESAQAGNYVLVGTLLETANPSTRQSRAAKISMWLKGKNLPVRIEKQGPMYYSLASESFDDLVKVIEQLKEWQFLHSNTSESDVVYNVNSHQAMSLEGVPSHVKCALQVSDNKIRSLHNSHKYVKQIDGAFYCYDNPLKESVLSLFLIKGITEVGFELLDSSSNLATVEKILNKNLKEGRAGLPKAQNELIEAGLEEYAQI